jgi:hypothetical protein
MRSFWKRPIRAFAVVLAAGGGGALMAFGPAGMPSGAAGGPPTQVSTVTAVDFFSGSQASLEETANGAALAAVGAYLSPTMFLGVAFAEPADYAISTDFGPGQSGQGSAAGTAHFDLEGVFAFDFKDGMFAGPFDVSVDIAVADPTTVSASVSQGVTVQFDPLTGQTSVVRQHLTGNQALGDTAGSLSISVDFMDGNGFVPLSEATGVWGMVGLNTVHLVQQLH